MRGGAYDLIQKPIDRDYFIAALSRAIRMRQLRHQVQTQQLALQQHADELERLVQERTSELLEANRAKDELLSLLDTLLTSAPVGLAFLDRDLRYVRVNDAFATMNGGAHNHILGRTVSEVVPNLAPALEPLPRRVLFELQPARVPRVEIAEAESLSVLDPEGSDEVALLAHPLFS